MGWIPLDPEEQGETLVLTEADMLERELVQHYGANYDEPDSFLIALGRRDQALEHRVQSNAERLARLEVLHAYEAQKAEYNKTRQSGADANAEKKRVRDQALTDWVDDYVAQRRAAINLSASALATRFINSNAVKTVWPAGEKIPSVQTLRKVISPHLKTLQK